MTPKTTYSTNTVLRKKFGRKYYLGKIVQYDPNTGWYDVEYEDGDKEQLDHSEVEQYKQNARKVHRDGKRLKALLDGPARANMVDRRGADLYIPTPKSTNCHKPTTKGDGTPCTYHMAMNAGSIFEETLGKMMSYKELIKHPDPIIRLRWNRSGENEFGRLLQGYKDTEGICLLYTSPSPRDS